MGRRFFYVGQVLPHIRHGLRRATFPQGKATPHRLPMGGKFYLCSVQLPQLPEQVPQLPEQVELLGQPTHLMPFFFARCRKKIAPPKIATIRAMTIKSTGFIGNHPTRTADSVLTALSAFAHR